MAHFFKWRDVDRVIRNGVTLVCNEDARVWLPQALYNLASIYNKFAKVCRNSPPVELHYPEPDIIETPELTEDTFLTEAEIDLKVIIDKLVSLESLFQELKIAIENININLDVDIINNLNTILLELRELDTTSILDRLEALEVNVVGFRTDQTAFNQAINTRLYQMVETEYLHYEAILTKLDGIDQLVNSIFNIIKT